MRLEPIHAGSLSGCTKGMPGAMAELPLAAIASRHWNILKEDLPLPVAVLKETALSNNRRWMRQFLDRSGAKIAPHRKTTKTPQLFQMQLDDGAWAITAATAHQIAVYRRFGVSRIFLANQLVGRANIAFVLAELKRDPEFDFYCLVDSIDGVDQLAHMAGEISAGRPLQLLVELGVEGYRTGARTADEAMAIARRVKAYEPLLALRGIEAYEGVLHGVDDAATDAMVEALLDGVVRLARRCKDEALFAAGPIILSAGGSGHFDVVARALRAHDLGPDAFVLLRSGCYITHDAAPLQRNFERIKERSPEMADIAPAPSPALEVWGYVQSRPERNLALVTIGKRDISCDVEMPTPILWFRPGAQDRPQKLGADYKITKLNDQHAYLVLPTESPLKVGDMVACGVSHPCTTFDKWNVLCIVDDEYNVTGAVRTYF
ncbi:MAG: amino acid deaminase [Dongiaceae bacterium]